MPRAPRSFLTRFPNDVPVERVDVDTLRHLFNGPAFLGRITSGDLRPAPSPWRSDTHLLEPQGDIPWCTRSQIIDYLDAAGRRVVTVHRYWFPDDTDWGRTPDPKALLFNGIVYKLAE